MQVHRFLNNHCRGAGHVDFSCSKFFCLLTFFAGRSSFVAVQLWYFSSLLILNMIQIFCFYKVAAVGRPINVLLQIFQKQCNLSDYLTINDDFLKLDGLTLIEYCKLYMCLFCLTTAIHVAAKQ